jgi:hypothetical protein
MGSQDTQCLFCYEEFTEAEPKVTENFIGCPCKFSIHEECWAAWDIYECPICHTQIELESEAEPEPEPEPDPDPVVINTMAERSQTAQKFIILYVIIMLLIYIIKR